MFCHARSSAVVYAVLLSAALLFPVKGLCGKFPGELSQVRGTVEVQKTGRAQWFKAVDGLPVQLKDRIRTRKGSSCNLELDDGSLIFVDENTEASVDFIELTRERHTTTLGLWVGKLLNNIKKTPTTKMMVKCPTAVISIRGTEFAVVASSGAADIGVFEGEVAVSSAAEISGEELDENISTSTAAAQVVPSTAAVQMSTASVPTAQLAEVSVKPGLQTTVARGEAPRPPSKLSMQMQKNRDRLNELRGRVEQLREKLKRVKPEYLDEVRQKTLDRVLNIKEEKNQLRERLKDERDNLR